MPSNACPSAIVSLDKLDVPYPPPIEVLSSIQIGLDEINHYARPRLVEEFRAEVARHNQLSVENVVLVRDRLEALSVAMKYLIRTGKKLPKVVIPFPGFQELRQVVEHFAKEIIEIKLLDKGDSWKLSISSVIEVIGSSDVLLLDNPNDPTGSLLLPSLRDARSIISEACNNGALVVVDESFYEFSGVSISDLIDNYPCLVIVRSMEQAYALAGLGLAYVLASNEIARRLLSLASAPSRVSLMAGMAALRNQQYYLGMVERIVAERERVRQLLLGFRGIAAYRSWSNFLLVNTGVEKASEKLCDRGVAVASTSLGPSYVRVTIGTKGDNNSFLAILTRLVNEEETTLT